MTAKFISVGADVPPRDVAKLLLDHRISAVPVVNSDGVPIGMVSEGDLIGRGENERLARSDWWLALISGQQKLDKEFQTRLQTAERTAGDESAPKPELNENHLAADDLRHLVADFHGRIVEYRDEARRVEAQRRRQRAKDLIDEHVFDEAWRQTLHRAREAAENGAKECMLLRFPNEVCIDGGRAINAVAKNWPATLRGEPAEIYLRWERDLKPQGFSLSARVLEFPDGKPGDIGFFLVWGE
jgi:hypothetical protein